jgi:hypothetical protein
MRPCWDSGVCVLSTSVWILNYVSVVCNHHGHVKVWCISVTPCILASFVCYAMTKHLLDMHPMVIV